MTTADTQTVSTATYRIQNPATGEVVQTFETLADPTAEAVLARAHAAFDSWRVTPVQERLKMLARLADLVEQNTDEFARRVTLEMGKPIVQAAREASRVTEIIRYFVEHGAALLRDTATDTAHFSRAITRREPIGVVLGIEPWNSPMYQAMRVTVPNLVLGNTVLLKPSEITAGSTLLFDELIAQAGFPADVFTTLLASHDQVARFIADDRVRAVAFTGSDQTGALIGELAGRNIKPVVLELGGSDPFIVTDSADVVSAAATAASCRLYLAGQVCASPKRVIVTEGAADAFITGYVEQFRSQVVGDGFDPASTVGPLSSVRAADTLEAQYQDAIAKGATVLVEGGRTGDPAAAFFTPAVLTDLTPEMRLYHEEAFGPLGMIYRVPDVEAAIALANDSPYGLTGSVFAEESEAIAIAERIEVGGISVNAWFGGAIEVPFGGVKRSGVGRELGSVGLDAFSNIKTYLFA